MDDGYRLNVLGYHVIYEGVHTLDDETGSVMAEACRREGFYGGARCMSMPIRRKKV
jgi:hypothetical protein